MHPKITERSIWRSLGFSAALLSTLFNLVSPSMLAAQQPTATPIKHVIVLIGENRTFDHVFATYQPKNGESISNLLSKGIINADGTPGPNYFFQRNIVRKTRQPRGPELMQSARAKKPFIRIFLQ
ncbi:MAG: hypothetical protein NVS1B11_18780 [Terriglobales bacterium]